MRRFDPMCNAKLRVLHAVHRTVRLQLPNAQLVQTARLMAQSVT